jgi:hypothetical protein
VGCGCHYGRISLICEPVVDLPHHGPDGYTGVYLVYRPKCRDVKSPGWSHTHFSMLCVRRPGRALRKNSKLTCGEPPGFPQDKQTVGNLILLMIAPKEIIDCLPENRRLVRNNYLRRGGSVARWTPGGASSQQIPGVTGDLCSCRCCGVWVCLQLQVR